MELKLTDDLFVYIHSAAKHITTVHNLLIIIDLFQKYV